ncbi:MAG: sulfite exporter TauE/SafE family protein [Candidatus Thiodiazotropha sp.]
MNEISLSIAFFTGILGSFHCLGMCGGINGGYFIYARPRGCLSSVLAYHATRVIIYTLLGISGAALGHVLVQSGFIGKAQGILMIIAGILVTLLGLQMLGLFSRLFQTDAPLRPAVPFSSLTRPLPPWTAYLAGAFNGLVPCSLVFSVAVKAAATADPWRAGWLMLSFGVGTLPSMVAVSLLGASIGAGVRGWLNRAAGVGVVLLGLWTLYEGLIFYDVMRGLANW